ncbi:hypothetical protein [Streptomyces sp. NPDC001594]|uniref:hypothetical protein n=1 Tax=Streptomyces sp. NPDC001594 TaxID=3364590 RepID=UPI003689DACE
MEVVGERADQDEFAFGPRVEEGVQQRRVGEGDLAEVDDGAFPVQGGQGVASNSPHTRISTPSGCFWQTTSDSGPVSAGARLPAELGGVWGCRAFMAAALAGSEPSLSARYCGKEV